MGVYLGLDAYRGGGYLLGQAIGGDLINMTTIPPIAAVPSHITEEAIAVGLRGQRFHDEAGPYQARVEALNKQEQQIGHYIFDASTSNRKRWYVKQMGGQKVQADTLGELAVKIRVPAEALEQSVKEWNDFLASSQPKEPKTGRVQMALDRRPISERPFYSSPIVVGVGLSVGGFVTTESMQVVDVFGVPIPGLFAVGDCAGGLTLTSEMGGTHLGGGSVLRWVAGKAAATEQLAATYTEATFGQHLSKGLRVDVRMAIISVDTSQMNGKA
jgi:fumarate reductase flavoprotein subunit